MRKARPYLLNAIVQLEPRRRKITPSFCWIWSPIGREPARLVFIDETYTSTRWCAAKRASRRLRATHGRYFSPFSLLEQFGALLLHGIDASRQSVTDALA